MNKVSLLACALLAAFGLSACQSDMEDMTSALGGADFVKVADHMSVGDRARAPFGYVSFCKRHSEECGGDTETPSHVAMTPAQWQELNKVNEFVNNTVTQISDEDNYHLAEWWDLPDEKGGDCEDLALLKRSLLIKKGWPRDALLMATAKDQQGAGHAVLVAVTDKGDFVLDNRNWAIVSWRNAPYTWIKRQSREHPAIWVKLDGRAPLAPLDDKLSPIMAAAAPQTASPANKSDMGVPLGLRPALTTTASLN